MKPLSEISSGLLVIQIQIQAVCTGKSTFEERREGGSFPMLNNELIIRQLLGTWLWATVFCRIVRCLSGWSWAKT